LSVIEERKKQTLDNTDGAIKNRQSRETRETGNIGHTR